MCFHREVESGDNYIDGLHGFSLKDHGRSNARLYLCVGCYRCDWRLLDEDVHNEKGRAFYYDNYRSSREDEILHVEMPESLSW